VKPEQTQQQLIAALCQQATWQGHVRIIETHISTLLLAHGEAWKIKKPLDLGFLDYSTLKLRRHACHEELRLNRRLAPAIYLDVNAIIATASGAEFAAADHPEALEYAVHMRQFAADQILGDHLHHLTPELISTITQQIFEFQQKIERSNPSSPYGTAAQVAEPMVQNFILLRQLVSDRTLLQKIAAIEAWTLERHQQLLPLLAQRHATGMIREGHGDMHLGNIAFDHDTAIIFDGIEFSADLRWIDTINEIAFLLMDLDLHQKQPLAWQLLNQWLWLSGDFAALPLLRYYQTYRAMVRAKITAIRLQQGVTRRESDELRQQLHQLIELATHYCQPQEVKLLITYGPSGSGKSTLARQWIAQHGAIHIAADVERKRLSGLAPLERSRPEHNLYHSEQSARTYQRILSLGRDAIQSGFSAILDATWLYHRHRIAPQQLAAELGVPFAILAAQGSFETLRQRVEQRLQLGNDPSEATVEVMQQQLNTLEPLTPEEARLVDNPSPG
jgi:uncharacterized protein